LRPFHAATNSIHLPRSALKDPPSIQRGTSAFLNILSKAGQSFILLWKKSKTILFSNIWRGKKDDAKKELQKENVVADKE